MATMHPLFADVRKLLWYLGAWVLMGVFIALLLTRSDLATSANALLFALPLTVVYGFVAPSAYYVCRSLPMEKRNFATAAMVFGAASLVAGFTWLALCEGWNQLALLVKPELPTSTALPPHLAVALFAAGFAFYLLSILAHDVLIAFENVRLAERRAAESRVLARDAELQVLRTQINPHFLFNSLNSISALTAIDAAAARDMTIELANFFRQTLALGERSKITLAEEIALCRSFLAIEKIRFGKKLEVELAIDDTAIAALIPPMILQPLLENAIKHGIRDLVDGGTVTVKALARDGWLHISVHNPIDLEPGNTSGNGLGLKNLRQRFASLYGERARVNWTRGTEDFMVELTLPEETRLTRND